MQNDILASLHQLPDAALVAQVKQLIGRERGVTAEIIAHLAELETRDVHLRQGCPSLYVYCRDVLGLSEWEAYNRIEVGRAARRFPEILDLLGSGAVSLTAVRLLAPHLTADNHREILESARGKTKSEIEKMVARLSPRPDVGFSVRRIGGAKSPTPVNATDRAHDAPGSSSEELVPFAESTNPGGDATSLAGGLPPAGTPPVFPAAPPALSAATRPVTPLSPDRYTPSAARPWKSCAWLRTCLGTRSRREARRPSWIARSRRCWRSLRERSLPRPPSRVARVHGRRALGLLRRP
jgi:hypothetical protein